MAEDRSRGRFQRLRRTRSLNEQHDHSASFVLVDHIREDGGKKTSKIPSQELFAEYRIECQRFLGDHFPCNDQQVQDYVGLLKKIITDLLDQNECLVDNIRDIQVESENRLAEMRQSLERSAQRTEEVMLALESHELVLKKFVQHHCCQCCGCDMRLMEFKLCHGGDRGDLQCCSDPLDFNRCWFSHQTGMVAATAHQTSHWLANRQLSTPSECLHNGSNEMHFLNLVDLIDSKIQRLETENDQLAKENQMIRELNALLSFRQGPPLLLDDIREKIEQPRPTLVDQHPFGPYIHEDTLSLSPMYGSLNRKHKFFDEENLSPQEASNDKPDSSFGSFESCTSETRHQDNDSGCSTDLIPSQTDIQSLLQYDFDDDSDDLIMKSVLSSSLNLMIHPSETLASPDIETLRIRAAIADRVMPKLYHKLLYYMNQRNLLLCQFRQENRAREKCKKELSILTESLIKNLNFFEMTEVAKTSKDNEPLPSTNIVCS